ncbi:TetR/AcrR family transcriptional regulator [Nocardia goodfellowii]|uniref:AcrR family transcriptional regulator n=1 Tax=Nocardia goodfellowii TaxID=882446 RepID=A0ABS4QIZ5_9NOCA|nr:helix-turn-helix domain-containing protein [Nocardia goodfellowii]MBP2191635.1 AcrR family transcriptional regulator [Nocardia goodfellowii]
MKPASRAPLDPSTRTRILDATHEVLARRGRSKLSLSDVAAAAKVSRPTLYRFFSSKEELLSAFGSYELAKIEADLEAVTEGLTGPARLDAVLAFIVRFQTQGSYSVSRLIGIEPDYALAEVARVLPIMRRFIERLVEGDDAHAIAATIVRIAVSHYLIEGDDKPHFLDQLRHAARIPRPPSR